jgi:hypothetical protein
LRHVVENVFHKNHSVTKASHRQRNQKNHQPHRTSQTTLIALAPHDPFLQSVTLSAVVVKNALPQKCRLLLVFAHHFSFSGTQAPMGAVVLPFTKVPRQPLEKEAGGDGVTTQTDRMQDGAAQRSPGKVGGVHG